MFGFLKQKLKDAVSLFTKKADEEDRVVETSETAPEIKEEVKEEKVKEKKETKKAKKQKEPAQEKTQEAIEELKETVKEPKIESELTETKEQAKESKSVRFGQLYNCDKCGAIIDDAEFKQKGWKEINEKGAIIYLCPNCTPKEEKKGFFSKLKEAIVTKKLDAKQFDELFWELELVLLENNVAVEVIDKIKSDLKHALVDQPIRRGKLEEAVTDALKQSISELFNIPPIDVIKRIKTNMPKPYIICFFGVNGSGKTTTIAKLARALHKEGINCVFAASDTFRAAAIQQLEEHANNLAVKMIKHDYGSDSAAVAFDAVKYAEAHKINAVLIDTAGRMHSNTNLMDELKKIVKVVKPDLKIFVGESITGNDCIEQAQVYDKEIGIDGIILTKADVDDKGGAAISISYVTKKPILYLGMGQAYDDLKAFSKEEIINALGL